MFLEQQSKGPGPLGPFLQCWPELCPYVCRMGSCPETAHDEKTNSPQAAVSDIVKLWLLLQIKAHVEAPFIKQAPVALF